MEEENAIYVKTVKLESKNKNDLRQIYLPNIPNETSIIGEWVPPDGKNWCIIDRESCKGVFNVKDLKDGIFTVRPTHSALIPFSGRTVIPNIIHQVDVSELTPLKDKKVNLFEGFPNMVGDVDKLIASAPLNPILFMLSSTEQVKPENYEVEFSLLEQEE